MVRKIHLADKGQDLTEVPAGREFATPEALALAEHHLLLGDLETGLKNILLLIKRYRGDMKDTDELTIAEALFRDAIVQFVACFGDPKRNKLSKEEVFPTDALMASYNYVQDLRDAYAAHNFGPQRQCVIVVAEMGNGFGLSRFKLVYSTPAPHMFPDYAAMFRAAIKHATRRIAALEVVVKQQLVDLGLDGIRALPRVKVRTPDANEFRMSRKDFRAGKPGRGPRRSNPKGGRP